MYKVIVRYDCIQSLKTIKLTGYTENYPELGNYFSIEIRKDKNKIQVEFGKIFNITNHGDMLVIQTDFVVAEVWIMEYREEQKAEVISINPKTLTLTEGRITGFRKGGSKRDSLARQIRLMAQLKEDHLFQEPEAKPEFKLIKGEL